MADLGSARWPHIDGGLVVVPVGSVEQHGPHLPLNTDTVIAEAVAAGLSDAWIAPALAYGASGEHEGFPGTVSLGRTALRTVIVEYGRSICRWADRVIFVNGHGGNGSALVDAVTLLRYEGRDTAWFPCSVPGADAHAGRTETSLMLHIAPDQVGIESAVVGNTEPIAALMERLTASGVVSVSQSGVLGDPSGATCAEGADLLAALRQRFVAAVEQWTPDDRGLLR
ncbi:mycofactocin biosynthesis peptidyl-dipeptidase MftE [Rhodococcus sp. BP-149]|uniref:mycofactocin biosynthesis peptidyl-dipeptidase MftE n=1 Tax=unclassified Rhodococcus (in: high G+C Gram-positive bacteria) TaxID=192944 RepID=UPI001C9ABA4F|nr:MULTISPECIES: mycofactocin biosynthesis peptidyl-dipeptidase MftE [unclassified Rhodococcus (in: high G+C Gram-positive bacteria)]MBY6687817.1 mycofactocin biosynthesis peptidyl-dipeptidase MftE [Rhodococcus sp. BP-288]MBY6696082.1 mycofactocin biosynthesis peptidyl-dipeptidase MftE [Rhodococcus sp. BP-188]MBY6700679.1 mycofactocin biosynthesis peptidyl-dipeptidase MftE [Rhodococcus sp. BP-285]MBY6705076.1 mycofactocin biosynthesis peptidyl-dipeptidase MftE [Rhodococcus sp. BP-283]MBY671380